MKTKYFKKFAIRVDTVSAKASYVILVIPTVVFSKYGHNCRFKYSVQIAWLNWSSAILWKEHSEVYTHS